MSVRSKLSRVQVARRSSAPRKRSPSHAKPIAHVDVKPLTWGERLDIIDALSQVLDGVYAHLPLKRSLY